MNKEVYRDGVLIEKWDVASRTVTHYDRQTGLQIDQRQFTADERNLADEYQANRILELNRDDLLARIRSGVIANRAHISALKPVTSAAQASQAYDGLIRIEKMVNALTMLIEGDVSDTTGT